MNNGTFRARLSGHSGVLLVCLLFGLAGLLDLSHSVEVAAAQATDEPSATGKVLFESNFAGQKLAGWAFTPISIGDTPNVGLVRQGDTTLLNLRGDEFDGTQAMIQGGEHWTDYTLDLKARITAVDRFNELADMALIVRSDTVSSDFVAVFISTAGDRALIGSVIDGQIIQMDGASYPFEVGNLYDLRVNVQGDLVELYVDNQPVIQTHIIEETAQGSAGVSAFLGTTVEVADVRVTTPSTSGGDAAPVQTATSLPVSPTPPAPALLSTNTQPPFTPSAAQSPAVTPTATASQTGSARADITVTVLVKLANLRSGPGTGYSAIGTVQEGTILAALAQASGDNQLWILVADDQGRQAWILSNLLSLEPENAKAPKVTLTPTKVMPLSDPSSPETSEQGG